MTEKDVEFWRSLRHGLSDRTRCTAHICYDEYEWRKMRRKYLCASEAACVIGIGFKSNVQLWEQKTNPDYEDTEPPIVMSVRQKGIDNEPLSKRQWEIDTGHKVWDGTHVLCVNESILDKNGKPFLACTLDAVGRDGLGNMYDIELKRSESIKLFSDSVNMPDKYRAQVLHQMLVTGLPRAVLLARIVWFDGDGKRHVVERDYWLDADDPNVGYDMEKLLEVETKFWNENVLEKVRPPRILPEL